MMVEGEKMIRTINELLIEIKNKGIKEIEPFLNIEHNPMIGERFDSYKDFSELLEHNKDVQFVANNLLHELYHCDMKKKMPTLHKMLAVENSNEETEWKGAISHF